MTVARRTAGHQDARPTDKSPTDGSPTYVGRPELRRRYTDGGQWRCTAAMQARVAATRRQCCNTRRENAATLFLQLSSRQCCDVVAAAPIARAQRHCCSKRRSNPAAARVTVAVLQQALQQRCGAASTRVVATLKQASWQRCGAVASSQQRRRATRWRGG
jgi:hypothetical protein